MRSLSRPKKRLIMLTADVLGIPLMLWIALSLRLGTVHPPFSGIEWLYLASLLTSVPIFLRMGLYRAALRYLGHKAVLTVLTGVTASVVLLAIVTLIRPQPTVPVSVLPIYWAFALLYVGGTRYVMRSLLNLRTHDGAPRVVIYGAGEAGQLLAAALSQSGRYQPVGFIDDNVALQGGIVHGLEVFARAALPKLVRHEAVGAVLLALPSLTRGRRQQIIKAIEPLCLMVQTVPDHNDIVAGTAPIDDVRDVHPGDLLGRDPVPPDHQLLDACIRGKVVMVTGAGGSIGAELCRQIVRLQPSQLLLFELSELALYNIERELRAMLALENLSVDFVALLGNVHHGQRFKELLQLYSVQTIYHSAAYKHVPIVQQNMIEGVYNNVFGTWHAAAAALEARVETFVLISTDKAVNPTSVMGATKRFAELVLQGLQTRASHTRFCMVRFGNVLGSSGSVAPLFREQISRGGPVTVTHPEVMRYFMTIPEAAQLVLQAGSMGKGGDVFVLDMGKPVRIADLAKRMINLMGLTVCNEENPEGDIEIVYTGLRPAEKLFEELLIGTNVTGTQHSMIMRAMEHSLPWHQVQQVLDDMSQALSRFDCEKVRQLLMQIVAEYKPTGDIHDLMWSRKLALAQAESNNVTALQSRRQRASAPPQGPTGH
ncbi:polysaccharide biosynthesis protein [Steroidobacter sp.]|uniref:polysaccharide biosynthesis protein n=1 Tax=Steroidobacter sp. TaxID=1978227 RepID=UPI001A48F84B|nr:nucleoside-diphosphate sugar epimerase/dehydratase [Steroidobacter sp.]MBL8267303.1 polysaccharide biosynthesis protein [Steroidobacter sp.]